MTQTAHKLLSSGPHIQNWQIGAIWHLDRRGDSILRIFFVGWVDWIEGRDEAFLAYIYVRQHAPDFDFGNTGLFDTDIYEYGKLRPWETEAPLPLWVTHLSEVVKGVLRFTVPRDSRSTLI